MRSVDSGFALEIKDTIVELCSWMERGGAAFDRHVDAERGFAAAALADDHDVACALLEETLARLPEETVRWWFPVCTRE